PLGLDTGHYFLTVVLQETRNQKMRETMVPGKLLYLLRVIALLCVALSLLSPRVEAQQTKRPFTVPAEIELTLLGTLDGGTPEVHFSPDGNYCAVWSERGQLDLNRV